MDLILVTYLSATKAAKENITARFNLVRKILSEEIQEKLLLHKLVKSLASGLAPETIFLDS